MKLNRVGKYRFKKPLEVTLNHNTEGWSLINEDLAIYAYGDTFDQAIISLEDEIESLLICFGKYDAKEIADGDVLKERLKEYIRIENDMLDEEDGECVYMDEDGDVY